MKTSRLLAATAASALVVAALAACAPAEKGGQGDQTRSGVTVSEATSATDFGGMDELVEAAKKEGSSTSSPCLPTGRTTAPSSRPSRRSTASRSTPPSPTRPARTRSTPPTSSRARAGARRVRPRPVGGAGQHSTCSRRTRSRPWDDIPTGSRTRSGAGPTTTAATCRSATTAPRFPPSRRVNDLLKPGVQGQGRAQRRPHPGRRGVQRRDDGGGRQRRLAPTTSRRASTSSSSSRRPGNFLPVDPTSRPSSRARPRSSSTGTTSTPRDDQEAARLEGRRPRRRRDRPATTSRRSTRTRRIRLPRGSGRSSSTPTRARTCGSRAAPGRSRPPRW